MISLTNTAQYLKKYSAPLIFAVLIVVFIALIILRYAGISTDKNQATIDAPFFDKLLTKQSAIYVSRLKYSEREPKSLPIYSIADGEDLFQKGDIIAKKLGFTNKPIEVNDISLGNGKIYTIPYSLLNLNSSGAMSVYKNVITYKKDYKNLPPSTFSIETLKNKSLAFFNSIDLDTNNLSEPDASFLYLKDGNLVNNTDQDKANFVSLDYFRNLEGLKLVSQNSKFEITMDTFGNPVSFIYNDVQVGDKQTEYSLISAKDAQKLVTSGQGQLIELKDSSSLETIISQLPALQLQKMYLAYFYNPAKPDISIQPVWFFESQFDYGKSKITATFAVPAIKSKYFKTKKS